LSQIKLSIGSGEPQQGYYNVPYGYEAQPAPQIPIAAEYGYQAPVADPAYLGNQQGKSNQLPVFLMFTTLHSANDSQHYDTLLTTVSIMTVSIGALSMVTLRTFSMKTLRLTTGRKKNSA